MSLAGGSYAADMSELAVTASKLKADTANVAVATDPQTPVRAEQAELTRVRQILSFGGGILKKDAAFVSEWFPKFYADGLIGRAPTEYEVSQLTEWFPNLAENKNLRVTGEACGSYNCISWSVGITGSWEWPGDGVDTFDKFYLSYGYIPLAVVESSDTAEVAYWESADGDSTHGCRHVAGDIWESKLGGSLRILHTLKDLEGDTYGYMKKLYRRATTEELAALGVTPKDPGGNGVDPCATATKGTNRGGKYDLGSPYSKARR